jgi:hypothetical protein
LFTTCRLVTLLLPFQARLTCTTNGALLLLLLLLLLHC